jgi:hypothetical protein
MLDSDPYQMKTDTKHSKQVSKTANKLYLDLCDLASPPVAPVLILPLPVHAPTAQNNVSLLTITEKY